MSKVTATLMSPVGRKFLTGITGIGLVVFVIMHLLGNLQIFVGPDLFNSYAFQLEKFGLLLYILEFILLIGFILHAVVGINIYLRKKRARTNDYEVYNTAGDPSKQNFSSRSMIVTGSVIFVFTIFHVLTFKYGPGINEGYIAKVNGIEVRDIYKLVSEKFHNIFYVIGYVGVMILIGLHLRHGIWSAFQSLGLMNKKYTPALHGVGVAFAIFIALGFLVLPVWLYLH
jgi:succinate dehydrogenase / fumarate reductase cytochrome b subunit